MNQSQALAMLERERVMLGRRMEVTDRCARVLEKMQQVYGDPEQRLNSVEVMVYAILNVNLEQLKLAQVEGVERLAEIDSVMERAKSPIAQAAIVPPGQGAGRLVRK